MKRLTMGAAFAALILGPAPQSSHASGVAPSGPSLALAIVGSPQGTQDQYAAYHPRYRTRYGAIRWQPRRQSPPPPVHTSSPEQGGSDLSGFAQFHGGFFAPTDESANRWWLVGFRMGTDVGDHVQLGVGVDWGHRTVHETELQGSGTLPSGGGVERRFDLSSASSDLVPALAFFQVTPFGKAFGPYVGIAGGYEALFVTATDFTTGQEYNATFDGWGWQYYAGFAFPITRTTKLAIEGYANVADLDREVTDESGQRLREIVDAGGAGVRGGLTWAF